MLRQTQARRLQLALPKMLLMLQLLTPALASSLPAAAIQLAALAVAANKAMLPASCCKLGAAAAYRLLMRLQ